MKILVVGGGGREHALTWGLSNSSAVSEIFCCPGSDAIQKIAVRVPIALHQEHELVAWARKAGVDFVLVGPEAPICGGLCDHFREAGVPVVGPSALAARLEASKVFAKEFMRRNAVPTAAFRVFDNLDEARAFVEGGEQFPIVIKADGLAAGKGVAVCRDAGEAETFLKALMHDRIYGESGERVVIEDCLFGEECSHIVLCDGTRYAALVPSQDHKRLLDHDEGPNTGGMGAYACDEILSAETRTRIDKEIVEPTLAGLRSEGYPFQGILYFGLMLTPEGPKVLEYNVRMGDPEAQPIVMLFDGDWAETLRATATGSLDTSALRWYPGAAMCVVLAAQGYPSKPQTGDMITGLDMAGELPQVQVFHAGTRLTNGLWKTAGGRVLGVTARGLSLAEAAMKCYEAVNRIHFDGMHYRRDIGSRGLRNVEDRR